MFQESQPAANSNIVTASPQGRAGKWKIIVSVLLVVFSILGIGAGYFLIVKPKDLTRSRAAFTSNIGDKITVNETHIGVCASRCTDPGTCKIWVNRYKCDSNNMPGGCQENGTNLTFNASVGSQFGFDTAVSCGTQQIDLGCKDANGTYGNVDYLSYAAATSCGTGATNPPAGGCTEGSCTLNVADCGSVGKVAGSGSCQGGICCKTIDYVAECPWTPNSPQGCVGDGIFNPQGQCSGNGASCIYDSHCPSGQTCQNWTPCCDGLTWGPNGVCGCAATSLPSATPTATPTNTPTDLLSAQCLNIKMFDNEWASLSVTDLATKRAGDIIRFTVAGSATSGTFSKARFTINGTIGPEVTQKRPGTEEYYYEFTIPSGVTTFTVKGEVYHSALGWN